MQHCLEGHELRPGRKTCGYGHSIETAGLDESIASVEPADESWEAPFVESPGVQQPVKTGAEDRGDSMADEMTYNNGYHYVRDDNDNGHDGVLLGQHLGTVGSAGRDIDDAGRDLTSASADANRDLINANADANRDLISALHGGDQHSSILAAVLDSRAHVTDALNHVGRDVLRDGGATREEVAQQGKENIIGILDQGSRGRETTLAQAAEIRNDIADAHSQNLLAHCETQKLVIKEHCETREAVREEGVRTREVVIAEARACLERELARVGEENTLLKLQLNLLSSGTGPLSAK